MKIGLFGGTFDPPHVGHLIVAQELRHQLALDRLLIVPASIPPHKRDRGITPGPVRLEMVRAAFGDAPGYEVSELELKRSGPSYTVDTLRALRDRHPGSSLFLAMGADQLEELESWQEPEEISRLATLVGFARAGQPIPTLPGYAIERVEVPHMELSSTEIRRRAAGGAGYRFMVPAEVFDIIQREGLYAARSR